jgi:MFS transporter, DHA2 family, glioxin efflux transporter
VIGTGATEVRTTFSATDLPFILQAYVKGIQTAFIVAIALAAACTVIAFGAKWQKMQSAHEPLDTDNVERSSKTEEANAMV